MKKTDIECFPIYRMTASKLEEKYRTDGYIHMNINALETRWPCQKDFVSAAAAAYIMRERAIGFCWSCEHLRGRGFIEGSIKSVQVEDI